MVFLWEVCSESMFQMWTVCLPGAVLEPPWSVRSVIITKFWGAEGPFVLHIYHVYHSLLECKSLRF